MSTQPETETLLRIERLLVEILSEIREERRTSWRDHYEKRMKQLDADITKISGDPNDRTRTRS